MKKNCKYCGAEFEVPDNRVGAITKYCSEECRRKGRYENYCQSAARRAFAAARGEGARVLEERRQSEAAVRKYNQEKREAKLAVIAGLGRDHVTRYGVVRDGHTGKLFDVEVRGRCPVAAWRGRS